MKTASYQLINNCKVQYQLPSIKHEIKFCEIDQKQQEILSIEGRWSDQQNIKFVAFMQFHAKIFASKERRKSFKIFKHLSSYLVSKNPRQCRSHYKKIMDKFKKFTKVKAFYENIVGPLEYHRHFNEVKQMFTTKSKNQIKKRESVDKQVQTDTLPISIQSLGSSQLFRLMNLLQDHYRRNLYPFNVVSKEVKYQLNEQYQTKCNI